MSFGFPNLRCAASRAVLHKFARQFSPLLCVASKDRVLDHAILQACKVSGELVRGIGRKPIDHPVGFLPGFDQAMSPKISQVLGDFHLRLSENLLKVANAEFTVAEQVQDSQTGQIAQTLVDFNEVHKLSNIRPRSAGRRTRNLRE
jgi:hypothetical protein